MSTIPERERRKVEFIRKYRQLCERYGMMIAMENPDDIDDDDDHDDSWEEDPPSGYLAYVVMDITAEPIELVKAVEELLIEEMRQL